MAFTLSNMLVEIYKELGQLTVSTATGGSNTTVVDSKQVKLHGDDSWNDGAVFVIRDAAGASAAPEGEFGRISDYVDSSGTFTVAAFSGTSAVASGDTFGFINNFYPIFTMQELCNTALTELGDIPLVDTTTLDTASTQTEYTAAVAWKRRPPYRVDIQGKTGDTNDNQWEAWHDWEYVPATAGSTGLIVLIGQPAISRDIRVWYRDSHPVLTIYSSKVYEGIQPDLAKWAGVAKALEWQVSRLGGSDPFLLDKLNKAEQRLAEAKRLYPVWKPRRKPRLLIVGLPSEEDNFDWPAAA